MRRLRPPAMWHALGCARAMRVGFVLLCLLYVTGCDEKSPAGPTVPLNERFTLAAGETVAIAEAGMSIQFLRVTGDSRCPADAVCILGGDAVVEVRAFDGGDASLLSLHTGDASQSAGVHRGASISLVELQPYPFSSRTIDQDDYRATLMVRR